MAAVRIGLYHIPPIRNKVINGGVKACATFRR